MTATVADNNDRFRLYYLHPKFWLTWLGLGCWRLLIFLPYPLMLRLGKGLGLLIFLLNGRRKAIAARNLELCFPDLDENARQRLLRENFINYGIAFFEVGIAWWWSNRRFRKLVQIEGLEHLRERGGQGALLTAFHFTTLEIGASAVSMYFSIDGVYRPHNNPVYDYFQKKGRSHRDNGEGIAISRDDIRTILKSLRSGRVIWYAPDQDYGARLSVFAPFFGIPAASVFATAKLSQTGKADIIPMTQARLPDGKGYKIIIYPPLEGFPVGDREADATRINQLAEKLIAAQPEAYMWVHRRFKTRPLGEPSLYPSSTEKKKKRWN